MYIYGGHLLRFHLTRSQQKDSIWRKWCRENPFDFQRIDGKVGKVSFLKKLSHKNCLL